ncbi:hypothetical protein C8J57DRAFT_1501751 [Mycena rebaudengoi]|nr:hypothetical protein C8J57DRAFT_1501751 [Mycena rebaudengoi]
MFFRLSRVLVAALPVAAVLASPHEARTDDGSCNVSGGPQCCALVGTASELGIKPLLGIPIDTILAFGCILNIVNCPATSLCCQGNTFNGFLIVNFGCSPIV